MKNIKPWHWVLLAVLLAPIAIVLVLGLLPAPGDTPLAESAIIVGAQAASNAATSFDIAFPAENTPADNPSTPEKEQLGYLLFFDPVLSTNDDISCATCHHPDMGFADGRPLAMGAGGVGVGPDRTGGIEVDRHAPSLYNKVFETAFFWDGRATTLEQQAELALTNPIEMNANPDELVADLSALPEYQALFAAAFPDDANPVTFENVTFALAAFERTLRANASNYDQYAQGDLTALTPAQKRGLALFRSAATGCYNCHAAPTFSNGEFATTGITNANGELAPTGRDIVTGDPLDAYAAKVPSLRNVGLTAPYMHNGSLSTLEDVLAFYMAGGSSVPTPGMGRGLRPFTLTEQEQADLLAFLYALTDESSRVDIPTSVPSGLPVVPALDNPLRAVAEAHNTGSPAVADRAPTTLTVTAGESIQAVVDQAVPGDVIEIEYGTYNEMVLVEINDLTVRGIPNAAGEWPVMDGENAFTDAFTVSGNGFTIEQLEIRNYTVNGVFAEGVTNITFRDMFVADVGIYGIYPVKSTGVLVERIEVTGIKDAGIYVGQSADIIVRDNIGYGNVLGIEVENSVNADVYNNHMYDNSCGIFISLLPGLTSKVSQGIRVYDNLVENNNLANFATPDMLVAIVPDGTGILVLGSDDVEVYNNIMTGNQTVGLAVFSSAAVFDDIDMPPTPERFYAHSNSYENNGYNANAMVNDLGIYGADILWDGSHWEVRFDDQVSSAFPPVLPSSGWPALLRRAYWQVLNFVITNLG